MTTRQLYYLVTIADYGNLSAAAQVLGISQPALSKFLTEYEHSLDAQIFIRYHRQLTPTAVGRLVIESAQKILNAQTRMLQTMRAVTGVNHTRIRLGTAPNRGAIIYSRIYNQFSRRYPDISLSLSELYASEQPGAIQHGQIDLAIGSGKTSDRVTDLPIAYEELLVSLPVSHPLAHAERIQLSDLRDTPFVLQGTRHSIRLLATELFEKAGFNPVVAFESEDVLLVDSMLHQAVGAGLVSQAHVFPCDELVYRPLDPPVHQTLHIRWPLGHTLTESERYLAGLLIRERLSDPRYKAILTPEVEELLHIADQKDPVPLTTGTAAMTESAKNKSLLSSDTGKLISGTAPEINLNTQILRYIIAIVDEKSLSRAADKYYLTQPALSRHLRNVEQMLCTALFTRVHNRLRPNNAGAVFVNFARNILQIESELTEHLKDHLAGHGGGIHLQCDPLLTEVLHHQVCADFLHLHPDIPLVISEGSRESTQEALLNASADFGIYFSCEDEHPILDSRILAENELVYFHAHPYASSVSELNPVSSRVMLAPVGSALRAEQERILANPLLFSPSQEFSAVSEPHNVLHPERISCEATTDILRLLADAGVADTILPASFFSPKAAVHCSSFQPPQHCYLLLVRHPGRNLPSPVRDLMNMLYDAFDGYFSSK